VLLKDAAAGAGAAVSVSAVVCFAELEPQNALILLRENNRAIPSSQAPTAAEVLRKCSHWGPWTVRAKGYKFSPVGVSQVKRKFAPLH
jgi:hypothetical protein